MVWVKTEQNRRMDRNRAYIMVVGTSGPSNPFLAGGFHEYFYVQPLHGMIDPTSIFPEVKLAIKKGPNRTAAKRGWGWNSTPMPPLSMAWCCLHPVLGAFRLVCGDRIIDVDMTLKEDRALFHGAQKLPPGRVFSCWVTLRGSLYGCGVVGVGRKQAGDGGCHVVCVGYCKRHFHHTDDLVQFGFGNSPWQSKQTKLLLRKTVRGVPKGWCVDRTGWMSTMISKTNTFSLKRGEPVMPV